MPSGRNRQGKAECFLLLKLAGLGQQASGDQLTYGAGSAEGNVALSNTRRSARSALLPVGSPPFCSKNLNGLAQCANSAVANCGLNGVGCPSADPPTQLSVLEWKSSAVRLAAIDLAPRN